LNKNEFKRPIDKESTMSTPSGFNANSIHDAISQDTHFGGCSEK